MKNDKIKVFVYGTLMSSRTNHHYLSDQTLIGTAVLKGYEMHNVRSYPGIVPKEGEYVLGELYEISQAVLPKLDRLEGEGYLYKRVSASVEVSGEKHSAYVYVWLGSVEGCRKVETGEMPWNPIKVGCMI